MKRLNLGRLSGKREEVIRVSRIMSLFGIVLVLALTVRSYYSTDVFQFSRDSEVGGLFTRIDYRSVSTAGFISITRRQFIPENSKDAEWLKKSSSNQRIQFLALYSASDSLFVFAKNSMRIGFFKGIDGSSRVSQPWQSIEIPYLPVICLLVCNLMFLKYTRRRSKPMKSVESA